MTTRLQLEIRQVRVTPWKAFGLDEPYGPRGISKRIQLTTNYGMREQAISLCYDQTTQGWARFALITTNYSLADEDQPGYFALEILGNGERIAAVVLRSEKREGGEALTTDNPKDFGEIVASFISQLSLTFNVQGPSGLATSFPVPADPSFAHQFRLLADAVEASSGK